MTEPSRNSPCPCGSGRKYKHCCGAKGAAAGLAYSRADRERAFDHLSAYGRQPEFEQDAELAMELFWGGRLDDQPDEVRDRLGSDEQIFYFYLHWFLLDLSIARPGDTIASRFLAAPGVLLTAGQRTWLERMADSSPRAWEVTTVRRDEGLDLKDLWSGETISVRERLATRQLAPLDLLVARVIEGEHGDQVLEGPPFQFAPMHAPAILKAMRKVARGLKVSRKYRESATFFKQCGHLFAHLWLDLVVLVPNPSVVTVEGDAMAIVRVTFDVLDGARVREALEACAELDGDDDDTWAWIEPAGGMMRSLGTVTLTAKRCVLETFSEARGKRGRKLLEEILGGAAKHRSTVVEDVWAAVERHGRKPAKAEKEIPPELEQEIVGQFLEKHYREWVDIALPALKGFTPREAARTKAQRPELVALIKQLESSMAAERKVGRPAVDVSWMWEELGIPRP